jgi:hypothetical protein
MEETEKVREFLKDMTAKAYDSQVGYGRWVLATLITLHGGSLFLISQSGPQASSLLKACALPLIIGLFTTVLTGALAWINYTLATSIYTDMWSRLQRGRTYEPGYTVIVAKAAMYAAIGAVVVSLLAFVFASYEALCVIKLMP